jgi:hypothetical protein
LNPLSVNLIRTYVPVLAGALASYLAARGIHVQPQQTAWAVAAMTGVFTAAYYTIVRVLEEKFPALGPLLLLSRPAVSLHVAGECPAAGEAEDYGEDWPPRGEEQTMLHPVDVPSAPVVPLSPSVSMSHLAAPMPQPAPVTRPEMLRVRKADTGAIPVYKRPPGR